MTCRTLPTCNRRDVLRAAVAAPVMAIVPFAPIDTSDDDDVELGPMGMADAKWLARWQRAAWKCTQEHGGNMVGSLEVLNVAGPDHDRKTHRAYVCCGTPYEVHELGAMALARVRLDGLDGRISDVYQTADGHACAIVCELPERGAA